MYVFVRIEHEKRSTCLPKGCWDVILHSVQFLRPLVTLPCPFDLYASTISAGMIKMQSLQIMTKIDKEDTISLFSWSRGYAANSRFHRKSSRKGISRASDMGSSTCTKFFYDRLTIHNTNPKEGIAFRKNEKGRWQHRASLCMFSCISFVRSRQLNCFVHPTRGILCFKVKVFKRPVHIVIIMLCMHLRRFLL